MKFIGKPMIALAIILVAILLIPNYKAAFGYYASTEEGFMKCAQDQKPFGIRYLRFDVFGIEVEKDDFGRIRIFVSSGINSTGIDGVLTSGSVQRSPDGHPFFVLLGQMREDSVCQKRGPNTAFITITGTCDGSNANFTSLDQKSATFTNLRYNGIPPNPTQDPTRSDQPPPELVPFCLPPLTMD